MNRQQRRAQKKIGPTGRFPRGKITPADEGELNIGVAVDLQRKVVFVNFNKAISWLGMPKKSALDFANGIIVKANELPDEEAAPEEPKAPEEEPKSE